MKLLLLSGNNVSNEAWIDLIAQELSDAFDVHVHRYRHWRTGERYIDLEHELIELDALVRDWDEYVIFAKSVGTVLTMKGAFDGRLKPKKGVFVGLPIQWSIDRGFKPKEWLQAFSVPTLFIQQQGDPFLSFKDLEAALAAHGHDNVPREEIAGDSHEYEDVPLVASLARNFLLG